MVAELEKVKKLGISEKTWDLFANLISNSRKGSGNSGFMSRHYKISIAVR